jgi:hypothetical protein
MHTSGHRRQDSGTHPKKNAGCPSCIRFTKMQN